MNTTTADDFGDIAPSIDVHHRADLGQLCVIISHPAFSSYVKIVDYPSAKGLVVTDEMVKRALKADGGNDCYTTTPQGHRMRRLLRAALAGPAPVWANAPAVIAVCNDVMRPTVFVRDGDDWWKSSMHASDTAGLFNVTPLYPDSARGVTEEER